MIKILNIITYALGFLFFFIGLQWVLNPADAASSLGMQLLTGVGLSSQIGDFTSFFFVVGLFTLLGAYTKDTKWLYAPIALLGFAAIFRSLAHLIHGADFAADMIVVEILVASFLAFVVSKNK